MTFAAWLMLIYTAGAIVSAIVLGRARHTDGFAQAFAAAFVWPAAAIVLAVGILGGWRPRDRATAVTSEPRRTRDAPPVEAARRKAAGG